MTLNSVGQDRDDTSKLHKMKDGWPDLSGACDGRIKKKIHRSKERLETSQKYSDSLVTAPLPRFLKAGKQSWSVQGSL